LHFSLVFSMVFFLNTNLFADKISIEDLIGKASGYFGKDVEIEGYAACPECFQIESGGCSGALCSGNLVLQETETGGPSVILSGTYNGNHIASESDGCVLMSTPLHIGGKYRVLGKFKPFASSSEAVNYTITLDSFTVIKTDPEAFISSGNIFLEGTGSDRIEYFFDKTGKAGNWIHLIKNIPRQNPDDRFDTTEHGTFKGNLIDKSWNGQWSSFFANGKLRSSGTYVNGAKNGLWQEFDTLGAIISKGSFVNGQEQGFWNKKIRNSSLLATFDYSSNPGKIIISEYVKDSVLESRVTIDRTFSTVERFVSYFYSGKIRRIVTTDPQSGTADIREWLENGQLICKQLFAKSVFTDSLWHANGKLWKVKKKDIAGNSNDFFEWYENGKCAWQGAFTGFAPQGIWTYSDSQGNSKKHVRFVNGAATDSSNIVKDTSYTFTSFTNTNKINTLVSTRFGIWAGTDGGACLFSKNGSLVSKLTTASGLPGNTITSIAEDSAGNIWFGSEHNTHVAEMGGSACCITFIGQPLAKLTMQNGYLGTVATAQTKDTLQKVPDSAASEFLLGAKTQNGNWNYHDIVDKDQFAPPISAITISANNEVWYSSLNGVQRISPRVNDVIRNRLGSFSGSIEARSDSSIWIPGTDSVYRIKNDSITGYKPVDSIAPGELISLYNSEDKNLYLLSTKAVFAFVNNSFRKILSLNNKSIPVRTNFYRDADGSFLIATNRGIERISKKGNRIVTGISQLQNSAITAFVKDSYSFWIGTQNGIYHYFRNHIAKCKMADGPRGEYTEIVRTDNSRRLWIYNKAIGIYLFDGETWNFFDVNKRFPNREILDICPDHLDGLWIGTNNGLTHLTKTLEADSTINDSYATGTITHMTSDNKGNLWYVNDQNSIVSFDRHSFREIWKQPILIDEPIRAFTLDSTGLLWISNNRGVLAVKNGKISEIYTSANGLPTLPITQLFTDNSNTIFAASLQTVYRLNSGKWSSIFTEDNLNGSIVSGIANDSRGNLWVGTKNGLYRFYKDGNERFTQKNGLPGSSINDIAKGINGEIWIATENGLCKFIRKN